MERQRMRGAVRRVQLLLAVARAWLKYSGGSCHELEAARLGVHRVAPPAARTPEGGGGAVGMGQGRFNSRSGATTHVSCPPCSTLPSSPPVPCLLQLRYHATHLQYRDPQRVHVYVLMSPHTEQNLRGAEAAGGPTAAVR